MLPIRPNYLQRPVQAPPKFKTFKMDSRVNTGSSTNLVPTSLVTIPNFKWPADRWRNSPGNARQKFYHGVVKVTQLLETSWNITDEKMVIFWKVGGVPDLTTLRSRPVTRKDARKERSACEKEHEMIAHQHETKKIEYMDYSQTTAPNTRPVTTDGSLRPNINDKSDDEDLR